MTIQKLNRLCTRTAIWFSPVCFPFPFHSPTPILLSGEFLDCAARPPGPAGMFGIGIVLAHSSTLKSADYLLPPHCPPYDIGVAFLLAKRFCWRELKLVDTGSFEGVPFMASHTAIDRCVWHLGGI